MFAQLAKFGAAVAEDDDVRCVVLRSDDPDFFIAHFDVSLISTFPHDMPAEKATKLGGFHLMCDSIRKLLSFQGLGISLSVPDRLEQPGACAGRATDDNLSHESRCVWSGPFSMGAGGLVGSA